MDPRMQDFRGKCRVATVVILTLWIALAALYGLLTPISNGCTMTYMYPTYIPISAPTNYSFAKYELYLYHEGWKKIDFKEHIKRLSGVPVLFIPGNGGSYKQVRSIAAESQRAYANGPLEHMFYQEATLTPEEGGNDMDLDESEVSSQNQYHNKLDWFAVDLEGEHSAMDGQILEEHAEYVVYAIHRILDQYKESHDARKGERDVVSGSLPKSVILVGHSMGGFVARAAVVHPHLRKCSVETVLTLSSPHQSPPLAVQPSLAHYFASVNQEWKNRFAIKTSKTGHYVSDPVLSHVVVVSISGGVNDYQVRTNAESLEGIVPPSHGFMVSSTSMKNVWLSMEHQVILWCNQVVVQVSHALYSLIDPKTGHPLSNPRLRLAILSRMLRTGTPNSFNWMRQPLSLHSRSEVPINDTNVLGPTVRTMSVCPSYVHWNEDGLDRDLYIKTNIVTVLAMDGRRRWLDIQKLGSNGKSHFMLVTNLEPCFGVRIHLWRDKGRSTSDTPAKKVFEATSKMVHIPSRQAPRQSEPGSQTEQAPPTAVFWLGPQDMQGFRYLTISVAPRPVVSDRPPPPTSMAVGQFFNPVEGEKVFSTWALLLSSYAEKDLILKEGHPLAFSLSFGSSLGLLPITLSLKTTGCGIRNSGLPLEEAGEMGDTGLCKLRCFPPVALSWDTTAGLQMFPNLNSETIVADSSPAVWSSSIQGSEETTIMLMVDPHCSYETTLAVSVTAAASRFLLSYSSEIIGLAFGVLFFSLMCQTQERELDLPIPSMLTALGSNLRIPSPFLPIVITPIAISLVHSFVISQPFPPIGSYISVAIICYFFANGVLVILIAVSQVVFYMTAIVHVFVKTRWQIRVMNFPFVHIHQLSSGFSSFKVIRFLERQRLPISGIIASMLVLFVHPALGLFILLVTHVSRCHNALCSFLTASFRSHAQRKELDPNLERDYENSTSTESGKSFGDTQLEVFHYEHGLLILHLLATVMFIPSLIAWLQRIGTGHSFPRLMDSALCVGVILHGLCGSRLESFSLIPLSRSSGWEIKLSFVYMLAGCYCSLSGLALSPYKPYYPMATIGLISFAVGIMQRRAKEGDTYFGRRKHSHKY